MIVINRLSSTCSSHEHPGSSLTFNARERPLGIRLSLEDDLFDLASRTRMRGRVLDEVGHTGELLRAARTLDVHTVGVGGARRQAVWWRRQKPKQ